MSGCTLHDSAVVELYFYGELDPAERREFEAHLASCRDCRAALDELAIIRDALAARPDVCTPPAGDWSGFMTRLDRAVRQERDLPPSNVVHVASRSTLRRSYAAWVAMAALLALVTMSVLFVARSREEASGRVDSPAASTAAARPPRSSSEPASTPSSADPSLVALTEEHLERSKLVVLGLATKDAATSGENWLYERKLASALLNDTRLYRLEAEERGMTTLAGVLRDLEVVLLQTSLTEGDDPEALGQIQRLIRKRDLVGKMEVVGTTGI